MKRIIGTLKARLSRPKALVEDEQSNNTASVEDVLMPDIYAEDDVGAAPAIKILDPSSPDIDKSTGFDPYDTAVLRKK